MPFSAVSRPAVFSWLADVETPNQHEPQMKRPILSDISNNSHHPPKRARTMATSSKGSPVKKHQTRAKASLQLRQEQENENADDVESTPRLTAPTSFPPPPSSESSSNRSASPMKMASLRNMNGGLDYTLFDAEDISGDSQHPLRSIQDLIEKLDAYSRGEDIIPAYLRQELRSFHAREFRHDLHFDSSGHREELGRPPTLGEVGRIVDSDKQCSVDQEHEAAWNLEVHWPLAKTALSLSAYVPHIHLKSISVAKIQPSSLAPSRAGGGRLSKKMVDFAYVLASSTATQHAFSNLDVRGDAPSESLNHTCHNTIIDKPIAISIETKSSTAPAEDGLLQLSVWVRAHLNFLQQLLDSAKPKSSPRVSFPPLPLLVARGSIWQFLFATIDESSSGSDLQIHRFRGDFKSSTRIGVYGLLAALQLIVAYAQLRYRPWLETNALPLTPGQRESLGLTR